MDYSSTPNNLDTNLTPSTTPFLIVGAGMAGLILACLLAEQGKNVTLISKTTSWAETAVETNSAYAQGGMAVCLPEQNPRGDSFIQHQTDTLLASGGFANPQAIETLLAQAPELVAILQRWGIVFDASPTGELAFTQEAAHQTRRVIHAGGDATGKHLVEGLLAYAKTLPTLHFKTNLQLLSLIQPANKSKNIAGGMFFNAHTKTVESIFAQQTVLATGGLAGLFAHTTNPAYTTGEALAIAQQAGCVLKDMAFVQFHPTAFYFEEKVKFLVSEALRGEGGILRNQQGEAFAKRYHSAGELAPRDVVSRMIYQELKQSVPLAANVWLDMTHLPADFLKQRFPTIYQKSLTFGIDLTKALLPVAPAAHYTMGGIETLPNGQTGLANLWAIGECACTGLHGANRLASNSLLECGAMALEAFKTLSLTPIKEEVVLLSLNNNNDENRQLNYRLIDESTKIKGAIQAIQTELKYLLWEQVGVVRTMDGLTNASNLMEAWLREAHIQQWETFLPEGLLIVLQLQVAQTVVKQALALPQSVGSHYLSV